MERTSGAALVALGFLMGGVSDAAATAIPFDGTIQSATWTSDLTGPLAPAIAAPGSSGLIGTDGSGNFFATLHLPSFEVDLPGCGTPGSDCENYRSPTTYTVTDDAGPSSHHAFEQNGDNVVFSVFNAAEGEVSGSFTLGSLSGHIAADDLYAGQAFRADDRSSLRVTLDVGAVPLPASAPLFGGALIALGGVGYALKCRRQRRAA